jgi:hypothetical protein
LKESSYSDVAVRYFAKAGPRNTAALFEAVARRAEALNIRTVIVTTTSGRTAFEALDRLGEGFDIIAITHVTGFAEPNVQEMDEKDRRELEKRGVRVHTCQHAFGGIGRAVRNKLGTYQIDEIIAYTLRTFGHGVKVAVEVALMAADAGLVKVGEDVISVGGSGKGADSAIVLQPANSFRFFDLKVKEIICKPASF